MIRDEELRRLQDDQKKNDRRWQVTLVVIAGVFSLLGVLVGKWLSTQAPPPIVIHLDRPVPASP